jgi:hypothetical protein
MINYFVKKRYCKTVRSFLKQWDNTVRDLFRIIPYEYLPRLRRVEPGLFIFSDLERLSAETLGEVSLFADMLVSQFGSTTVFNHPKDYLPRFQMLQTLQRQGINDFRVFQASTCGNPYRFPVFLRRANDHRGPLTPLLKNREELDNALQELQGKGVPAERLMAVEFCNTRGGDGLYRKFSAFCIGETVIPWHIIFSKDWVTKNSKPEPLREEEINYLEQNPHHQQLLDAFRLAGVRYGRIDYGLHQGRIQIWEINTNPTIISPPHKFTPDKRPLRQRKVTELSQTLRQMHASSINFPTGLELPMGPPGPFSLDATGEFEICIDDLPYTSSPRRSWLRRYRKKCWKLFLSLGGR